MQYQYLAKITMSLALILTNQICLSNNMLAHEPYCKCKILNVLRLWRSSSIICVETWK